MKQTISRRKSLQFLALGAASVTTRGFWLSSASAQESEPQAEPREIIGDPRVRGPFPILSTPFEESGEVDYETLARQAKFVDWCGCSGMIWPQAGDAVDLLTPEEKRKGMAVLTEALKGRKSALCLGVNGKNAAEIVETAKYAESLAPAAIISRPPDEGKTQEDMLEYWRAIGNVVSRPVIIQTSGGTAYKGPGPSLETLIGLAEEFPHFGYVKEETNPIDERMQKLIATKPTIKRVFSAMGGYAWLRQMRFGTEGLITERAAYADLLERIWQEFDRGDKDVAADAFGKLEQMLFLARSIPCNELRGFHLHIWKKRGVFKNMLSRNYGPNNSVPEKPVVSEMKLTQEQIDQVESKFEAMKPYLRQGEFTE